MSIDPRIGSSLGTPSGVARRIADLERRLAQHQTTSVGTLSVNNAMIAPDAVQASNIDVATLSAISSNMGTLTAGTVTGATLQTATSGSRVVQDTAGIRGFATDGTTKVFEINTSTGIASFTGVATLSGGSVVPGSLLTGTIPTSTVPIIGGTNLIPNSGAERTDNSISPWVTSACTFVTSSAQKYEGTKSFLMTATGGNALVAQNVGSLGTQAALQPLRDYTFSAWLRTPHTTRTCWLFINFTDGAGNVLNSITASLVPTANTWQRLVASGAGIAGTVNATVYLYVASAANTETFYWDGVQFEPGAVVSAYTRAPGEILPDEVTTTHIAANAITAAKISVSTLSAISANMGTVTAGTLTGATVQTATSGSRVELTSAGFKQFIGASSTPAIHFKTDGTDTNVFTGVLESRGMTLPVGAGDPSIINWKDSGGGIASYITAMSTIPGGYTQLWCRTVNPTNAAKFTEIRLHAETSGSDTHSANLQLPAGSLYLAIEQAGEIKSDFMRVKAGAVQNWQVQTGSSTITMAVGLQNPTVTLPAAWPTNHIAFIATVAGVTHQSYAFLGSGKNNLSTGYVSTNNSGASQNMVVQWISIGN